MTGGDPETAKKPDYGIDAPGVVRNLLVLGAVGLGLSLVGAILGRPIAVSIPLGGVRLVLPLARMGGFAGTGLAAMGLWMLWESKVGKIRNRERLLDHISWTGAERVLDVGCGRGLLLIGAARRLTTGSATGIDLWQAEDLSGNRPEAARENARWEGVAERVDVRTADMRTLPFSEGEFDVAVSSAAIHNLYDAKDRSDAIAEICRVLKPGGQALIDDIRHGAEYAAAFSANRCGEIRRLDSRTVSVLLAVVTFGSLHPATLLAKKSG
jgi:arsenite methyltransferase